MFAACEHLKKYAVRCSTLSKSFSSRITKQTTREPDLAPAKDTAAVESTHTSASKNGFTVREKQESITTLVESEDGFFYLEDWQLQVRVKDCSPARESLGDSECGTLSTTRVLCLLGKSGTWTVHPIFCWDGGYRSEGEDACHQKRSSDH